MDNLKSDQTTGREIYSFARRIFPITRSLTGEGVRQTLLEIKKLGVDLRICKVSSGTEVYDWHIPNEWNISEAFIIGPAGEKIVDFRDNNLHVVGYSEPVDLELSLDELLSHVHSLPQRPAAIPYVTSYYERRWGFCMSENQRKELKPGKYRAVIKSTLKPGEMNYGEVLIPGRSPKEVFLSTYICHPSMANNEVSGPAVLSFIAKSLQESKEQPNLSYRIVFVPETIGAIAYISRNLKVLQEQVLAGMNVTCVGDDRAYSYLPSRQGNTLADRALRTVLPHFDKNFKRYSFIQRGSDERQYCAPGVDLPVCSFMRSKYGEYPEYHTSDDNLQLISANALEESFLVIQKWIAILDNNTRYRVKVRCEPQLGKRGLYSTLGGQENGQSLGKKLTDVFTYSDGEKDTLEVSKIIGLSFEETHRLAKILLEHDLIEEFKA
jgi:aminopeptidase-like protein